MSSRQGCLRFCQVFPDMLGRYRCRYAVAALTTRFALQWHKNRPLLARRSGVFQSAMCRNESLDVLGHLSSDGCMRPWCAPDSLSCVKHSCEPVRKYSPCAIASPSMLQWPRRLYSGALPC